MPTLQLTNHELYFAERRHHDEQGTAMFLHGAAGSSAIWPETFYSLPGMRVIALDLPGHGRSSPPGRRSIEHYVKSVTEFISAMQLRDVVLVGHSMGSAIALAVAARSSVEIRGLALIGAASRMPVNNSALIAAANASDDLADFIADNGLGTSSATLSDRIRQEVHATDALTAYGDFLACDRFDIRSTLATITTPTLIIAGEADRMTPFRFSESLAAGLPNAQLVSLPETGHFAMLEQTEIVKDLIANFCHNLAPSSSNSG